MHTVKTTNTRRDFIRLVTDTYLEEFPKEAAAIARYLKEITAQEMRSGKWSSGNGHVSIRFPARLFHWLRFAFGRANIFPLFGDDSEDIALLNREYPDLFKTRKRKSWERSKAARSPA